MPAMIKPARTTGLLATLERASSQVQRAKTCLPFTALLACLLLAGCVGTSEPANFYVIQPLPGTAAGQLAPLKLGIGPVSLPRMLDRPQIVTELDGNQVSLSEHHRWAENLGDNLTRVLGQNLASRLAGVDAFAVPGRQAADIQLSLSFDEFGGRLGKSARLAGVWRLTDQRAACAIVGAKPVAQATPFAIEIAVAGPGYGDFAEALRQGIGRLSDQIAAQVLSLTPGCGH
ncbi:MAG: PqiC family protein [Porticoccaceae bacterium]